MMTRFPFRWEKAVEAIDFLAQLQPGITQYYIGKVMFFADKEHLLDYGRPITGDRYVAMVHGPVPSAVRDLLKFDSGFPDEYLEALDRRLRVEHKENKQMFFSKDAGAFEYLSGSDLDYLREARQRYGRMSFGELKELSHRDRAYSDAWEKDGNNNEMNIELWFDDFDEPELVKAQLRENARAHS